MSDRRYHAVSCVGLALVFAWSAWHPRDCFTWLRDTFAPARNYYDRLGHGAQGFSSCHRRARNPAAYLALAARQVAVFPGGLHKPGDQRRLRDAGMVGGAGFRQRCRGLSRHAGGRVGYAVGYVVAMLGAITAQLLLSGWHGRSLRRLESR